MCGFLFQKHPPTNVDGCREASSSDTVYQMEAIGTYQDISVSSVKLNNSAMKIAVVPSVADMHCNPSSRNRGGNVSGEGTPANNNGFWIRAFENNTFKSKEHIQTYHNVTKTKNSSKYIISS